MATAIVLQARMGSRRLPGKSLAPLGSGTVLGQCILRLSRAGLPVIGATTDRREDDAVAAEATRLGAAVFRGDADDVLKRYLDTARAFGITTIIRATADNPCVDADGVRRLRRVADCVAVDAAIEWGLPVGAAVELVTLEALTRAAALITDPFDREHVTTFVRRYPGFRVLRALSPAPLRRPELRLTIDTADDLEFVQTLTSDLGATPEHAPLDRIIRAADASIVRRLSRPRARQGA